MKPNTLRTTPLAGLAELAVVAEFAAHAGLAGLAGRAGLAGLGRVAAETDARSAGLAGLAGLAEGLAGRLAEEVAELAVPEPHQNRTSTTWDGQWASQTARQPDRDQDHNQDHDQDQVQDRRAFSCHSQQLFHGLVASTSTPPPRTTRAIAGLLPTCPPTAAAVAPFLEPFLQGPSLSAVNFAAARPLPSALSCPDNTRYTI
jgi:hypothetical protein